MMKNAKKTYVAPAAELILLAPMEALAATLENDDQIALNKWGFKGVIPNASVTGSNLTRWCEDGKIR